MPTEDIAKSVACSLVNARLDYAISVLVRFNYQERNEAPDGAAHPCAHHHQSSALQPNHANTRAITLATIKVLY